MYGQLAEVARHQPPAKKRLHFDNEPVVLRYFVYLYSKVPQTT